MNKHENHLFLIFGEDLSEVKLQKKKNKVF
jgi:hypothetical protein